MKYFILFFILSPSLHALERRPILLRQLSDQKILTEKIFEQKVDDRELLNARLGEIDTSLGLIQGFEVKEKSEKLHRLKNDLLESLQKNENEIAYLSQNIRKLATQQLLLSRAHNAVR